MIRSDGSCASKRRRVPSPLRGGPTRPERPSGVGGAGVEQGGGKPGIVGRLAHARTSEFDPAPPTPTPPRKGEGKARRRARSLARFRASDSALAQHNDLGAEL